jgi:hypothetical protein
VIAIYLLSIPLLYWQRYRLRARGGPVETLPVSAEASGETDLTVTPFRK